MTRVTYTPHFAETGALMRSQGMQLMLRRAAEKGVAFAVSISPEPPGRSGEATGEFRNSFRITTKARGGVNEDRAEATITNTSPHAARVEWQDGYHVGARTADYIERSGP